MMQEGASHDEQKVKEDLENPEEDGDITPAAAAK